MKPSIKLKTTTLPLLIAFALPLVVSLALRANGQPPPDTLWYNGDFNGSFDPWWWNEIADPGPGGPYSCFDGALPIAQIYDDFSVPLPFEWNVTEVFSDNLNGYCSDTGQGVITGAVWEIRQGVSASNPGVLIAQGFTVTPVVTATGRGFSTFPEYRVEVQGLNVFLSPGTYHLNVTPINGTRYSTTGISPTYGTDCVGTPCGNNGNAFWNAPNVAYWDPITDDFAHDFAMGVVGNVNNNTQLVLSGSTKNGFEI